MAADDVEPGIGERAAHRRERLQQDRAALALPLAADEQEARRAPRPRARLHLVVAPGAHDVHPGRVGAVVVDERAGRPVAPRGERDGVAVDAPLALGERVRGAVAEPREDRMRRPRLEQGHVRRDDVARAAREPRAPPRAGSPRRPARGAQAARRHRAAQQVEPPRVAGVDARAPYRGAHGQRRGADARRRRRVDRHDLHPAAAQARDEAALRTPTRSPATPGRRWRRPRPAGGSRRGREQVPLQREELARAPSVSLVGVAVAPRERAVALAHLPAAAARPARPGRAACTSAGG